MENVSATAGTFADFRIVRGRKVAQVIVEIPLETADAALRSLGGLPNPAEERWIALALMALTPKPTAEPKQLPAPDKKRWDDLPPAQQAAIRCGETDFRDFLDQTICDTNGWAKPSNSDEAAQVVRHFCKVDSRADLNRDGQAATLWRRLDNDYWAWQRGIRQ